MSLEPPTLDSYFQNQRIGERLGPFQRRDKLGNTAKSRVRQLKGIFKLGPKLRSQTALRPLPRLLNTHSPNNQVLPWKSLGRWL